MGSTDSRNSEDNIYDVLRTDILNLKLRPGMIFSIRDISEAYQVGRTPVRDALISLSKEGLITFLPQRGTMISKINYDKVLNERFLRTCVEEKVILEFMAVCDLKAITELFFFNDTATTEIYTGTDTLSLHITLHKLQCARFDFRKIQNITDQL